MPPKLIKGSPEAKEFMNNLRKKRGTGNGKKQIKGEGFWDDVGNAFNPKRNGFNSAINTVGKTLAPVGSVLEDAGKVVLKNTINSGATALGAMAGTELGNPMIGASAGSALGNSVNGAIGLGLQGGTIHIHHHHYYK
jgi:hypothetical protein